MIKTVNGESTHFIYDMDSRLIAETPAGSNFAQGLEYLYRGKNLLAQADPATEAVSYYHTNYLGAVHQLTNAGGTILWEATYLPFGEPVVAAGSTVTNNWRLPGQYFDRESGLYYNYHRYYDPGIGRYLTPDPIGLEGGINLYAYVKNNPVNLIDPYGLQTMTMGTGLPIILTKTKAQIEADKQLARSLERFVENTFSKEDMQNAAILSIILSHPSIGVHLMGKGKGDKYGPLWNAPGMPGWKNPQDNDPNDPEWWKKPKNWDKMTKWQKFKWIFKKAAGQFMNAGSECH